MNPRTLSDILLDYQKATKLAAKDLDSVPEIVRPAHAVAIRGAKDSLPRLRHEYFERIMKNAYGFFVTGDEEKGEQFAKIAADSGAIVIDGDAIFKDVANRIQPTIGGRREFSVTQESHLNEALRELVEATGHEGKMNRVSIKELRVIATKEALVEYVRELITRYNATTPVQFRMQADITAQALLKNFAGKNLVVVIRGSVTNAPAATFFKRVTKVDVDSVDEVNEKFARDTIMGVLKPAQPVVAPENPAE